MLLQHIAIEGIRTSELLRKRTRLSLQTLERIVQALRSDLHGILGQWVSWSKAEHRQHAIQNLVPPYLIVVAVRQVLLVQTAERTYVPVSTRRYHIRSCDRHIPRLSLDLVRSCAIHRNKPRQSVEEAVELVVVQLARRLRLIRLLVVRFHTRRWTEGVDLRYPK